MLKKTFRDGFTLVELSFSLLFIGILSIIIVLIINNTVVAYRRGLLLGQINSSGRELTDDIRTAIQNSSSRSLIGDCDKYYGYSETGIITVVRPFAMECRKDRGYHLAFVERLEDVELSGEESAKKRPIYGALCTGSYSYVWNSGYYEYDGATFDSKENSWAYLAYTKNNVSNTIGMDSPFKLLKIKDEQRRVCRAAHGGSEEYLNNDYDDPHSIYGTGQVNSMFYNEIDLGEVGSELEWEELLTGDDNNALALYNLFLAWPEEDTTGKNTFYYVSFVLGTITSGADVTVGGSACIKPDEDEEGSIDYCAINKFNFAAQVNGG